jgi:hypothetical protein
VGASIQGLQGGAPETMDEAVGSQGPPSSLGPTESLKTNRDGGDWENLKLFDVKLGW